MNQMRTGSGGPPIPPPSIRDVQEAAGRISGVALRTPLLKYRTMEPGEPVWLKAECLQPAGSFKLRGVLNWARSLSGAELERGLSTQSAGNTAQALGYVARLLGVPARSLLPDSAPRVKVEGVRSYGVIPVPVPFSALMDYVFDRGWEQEPYSYLNPWGDPSMLAGSGTIGMEILDELPELQAVYIPVGGGDRQRGQGVASGRRGGRSAEHRLPIVGSGAGGRQADLGPGTGDDLRWHDGAGGGRRDVPAGELSGGQGRSGLRGHSAHRHRPRGSWGQAGGGGLRRHVAGGGPRRAEGRSRRMHNEWREHRRRPAGGDPHFQGRRMIGAPCGSCR